MFSALFIKRPIFASVISIVVMILCFNRASVLTVFMTHVYLLLTWV